MKIDRIRINKGGSALASMSSSAAAANNMAPQPFGRSSYGAKMMEHNIKHHKLTFNYGADSGLAPSENSIEIMRKQ